MAEPTIKKQTEMNKCSGGECPGGNTCRGDCTPENIISVKMLLKGISKEVKE